MTFMDVSGVLYDAEGTVIGAEWARAGTNVGQGETGEFRLWFTNRDYWDVDSYHLGADDFN